MDFYITVIKELTKAGMENKLLGLFLVGVTISIIATLIGAIKKLING